jgi:hypothetical protein
MHKLLIVFSLLLFGCSENKEATLDTKEKAEAVKSVKEDNQVDNEYQDSLEQDLLSLCKNGYTLDGDEGIMFTFYVYLDKDYIYYSGDRSIDVIFQAISECYNFDEYYNYIDNIKNYIISHERYMGNIDNISQINLDGKEKEKLLKIIDERSRKKYNSFLLSDKHNNSAEYLDLLQYKNYEEKDEKSIFLFYAKDDHISEYAKTEFISDSLLRSTIKGDWMLLSDIVSGNSNNSGLKGESITKKFILKPLLNRNISHMQKTQLRYTAGSSMN